MNSGVSETARKRVLASPRFRKSGPHLTSRKKSRAESKRALRHPQWNDPSHPKASVVPLR